MLKRNAVTTSKVGLIAPTELGEHHLHAKFFLEAEKKKKTATYHKSLEKVGKVNLVVFVEKDGQKLVIDGWGYVLYAIKNNIPQVAAVRLNLTSDEDIIQIMLELQFSDHSTPEEEYKIYSAAYDAFSEGKGNRTDLTKIEEDERTGKKERNPTIFDKIAAMTNANSAKRVQCILKVGSVNPTYLLRMEVEKMSLNSAYLKCISEEGNGKPKPNRVKKPATVSTQTATPQFNTSSSTEDWKLLDTYLDKAIIEDFKSGKLRTPIIDCTSDKDNIVIYTICKKCGTKAKTLISRVALHMA